MSTLAAEAPERQSEFRIMSGHGVMNDYSSPLPHTYLKDDDLPRSFSWHDVEGISYLTKSLNQHIPQYCGSCWAHGALSSLADRIKIARGAKGDDINLSIQYVLNCGARTAGSCHGGSATGTFQFIKEKGFVPYDTCMPYIACSSESKEGFCPHADTTCNSYNTCRTCGTFGTDCKQIDHFPNATIAEYGVLRKDTEAIKAEIYARGPVAAGVDAIPLTTYKGGIVRDTKFRHKLVDHIVSIVGWGYDEETGKQHWIVRNSWGQYWGEFGFFRVEMGDNQLGIESEVSFAVPGEFSIATPVECDEDGSDCDDSAYAGFVGHTYVDPSKDVERVLRRTQRDRRTERRALRGQ